MQYEISSAVDSQGMVQCGMCGAFRWPHDTHICSGGDDSNTIKPEDIVTCPWCGTLYAGVHICGSVSTWNFGNDARIAAALERIADALEKISTC